MASIFTYDPDPPRISSPWSTPRSATPRASLARGVPPAADESVEREGSVARLEAEPQQGSTEYKLHLLLRPRRNFSFVSTGQHVPGSRRSKSGQSDASSPRPASESGRAGTPAATASNQSRQNRLEQLTTQLLWRLQQSSPFHAAAAVSTTSPSLPDSASSPSSPSPQHNQLPPGLEDSRGALYEIGVADDGTFVGLAEDEMNESLNNLRAMATSLGCQVDVLRMVPVGECQWVEEASSSAKTSTRLNASKLWVAEAYVKPGIDAGEAAKPGSKSSQGDHAENGSKSVPARGADVQLPINQLRVSLTGATGSGKSSLLGTLSTSTLDNGRGKSRLSLLKHRHEIASGMTSSVTQELIGYRDNVQDDHGGSTCRVINYACDHVSSWTDIHATAELGRLVFLCDSPGHPRYGRTIVRGLIGWAPHWTLVCVPADGIGSATESDSKPSPISRENMADTAQETGLSIAHLELCLKLGLSLVVVVTKLDLAYKSSLRRTLTTLLSILKAAGRKPVILSDSETTLSEPNLQILQTKDLSQARQLTDEVSVKATNSMTVPIILTSVVKGTGMGMLHALLRELPIPEPPSLKQPSAHEDSFSRLFHIEETYFFSTSNPVKSQPVGPIGDEGITVVSGHLQYGRISIGDQLVLGPYPNDPSGATSNPVGNHFTAPKSYPGALGSIKTSSHPTTARSEWCAVRVLSVRTLRLPVRTLLAGQVGTVGLEVLSTSPKGGGPGSEGLVRIRRGMVLTSPPGPRARKEFVARFAAMQLVPGAAVVVHVASVRASAKIIAVRSEALVEENVNEGEKPVAGDVESNEHVENGPSHVADEDDGFAFGFEDESEDEHEANDNIGSDDRGKAHSLLVTFQFIASREFVEIGAQVLVMPIGGPSVSGATEKGERGATVLDGIVGIVVEGS